VSGRSLRKTFVGGDRGLDADLRFESGRLVGTLADGDGEAHDVDVPVKRLGAHRIAMEHVDRRVRATVLRQGDTTWVAIGGRTHQITVEEAGGGPAHHAGEDDYAASPMTGVLVKLSVEPHAEVAQGAELFVVEAMKMEYVVRAPRDVVIAEVRFAPGDAVEQGDVIVRFGNDA
jgi:3-methylcrotonyl-CoA carboxylase alpha subunit